LPQSKVLTRYVNAISTGQLRPDDAQRQVALRFGKAVAELEAQARRQGLLSRFVRRKPDPVRGVYLWGGVGRGKSMLMDLFFDCVEIAGKRRVHFHEFMQEVHDRLRSERAKETGDPILPVADAIAAEARLIAFDEMIVTNSADAMILSRLFTRIIGHGVTVVATSNRPPQDLYKNGLNREHFLPFIALLKDRLDVLTLDGPTDYRMQRLGGFQTWHVPNGDAATEALSRAFFRLTDFRGPGACSLRNTGNQGRTRTVRAQVAERRGRLLIQAAMRRTARHSRLSCIGLPLSHRDPGRDPRSRRKPEIGSGAIQDTDRRLL